MESQTLTTSQFADFQRVITASLGIKMPPTKRVMWQSRLRHHPRELGLEAFDVVFFRNVRIYFDRETQQQVVAKICRQLRPEGRLCIAHSGTLRGLAPPLSLAGTAAYRRLPERGRTR